MTIDERPRKRVNVGFAYGATDRGGSSHRDDLGATLSNGLGLDAAVEMVRWGHVVGSVAVDHSKIIADRFSVDRSGDPLGWFLGQYSARKLLSKFIPRWLFLVLHPEWPAKKLEAAWRAGVAGGLPLAADVLVYVRHSDEILEAVIPQIEKLESRDPPRVLIGLSLGGIILVDALSKLRARRAVDIDLLVTVGSQSSLLYACDALKVIRKADEQPAIFTPWLNVWARSDFLSYPIRPTFGTFLPYQPTRTRDSYLEDVEIKTPDVFPAVHSAYFKQPLTYTAIARALIALEVLRLEDVDPRGMAVLDSVTLGAPPPTMPDV